MCLRGIRAFQTALKRNVSISRASKQQAENADNQLQRIAERVCRSQYMMATAVSLLTESDWCSLPPELVLGKT